MTFYDSVTGLALFVAPRGRSWEDFVAESTAHQWPSFRDEEVVWYSSMAREEGANCPGHWCRRLAGLAAPLGG